MEHRLTRKEFLALPVDKRREILKKQASNPEIIEYYEALLRDEMAMQDKGMME